MFSSQSFQNQDSFPIFFFRFENHFQWFFGKFKHKPLSSVVLVVVRAVTNRMISNPQSEITIKNPLRDQNLSIQVDLSPLWHRRDLRRRRACWRRYQKRMQSSLAPPGRAIRRSLVGWPLPIWRVCQREAPHPVAGGGHWRRSDRDGPVTDDDLDAGPARDGDVVLTRDRCATVVPTR